MIRTRIARALRRIAFAVDGQEHISTALHTQSVRSMNKYIERTEARIRTLEELAARERVT